MANFLPSYLHVSNGVRLEVSCICKGARVYFSSSYGRKFSGKKRNDEGQRRKEAYIVQCCSTSSTPSSSQSFSISAAAKHVLAEERSLEAKEARGLELENLMSEFGWRVRRLAHNDQHEIREAVEIQAEAFHTPMFLFDDLFFQFFKAEVLSGLVYKLRNSPLNRYACLVAEPVSDSCKTQRRLVGVVDVTALRDEDVLKHLRGEEEYLYVSGIAVSKNFRRRKIASILLEACEMLSILWHFEYLVLRAYEDDFGARKLYANAGYKVVSSDPQWMAWTGQRRRVLMIKKQISLAGSPDTVSFLSAQTESTCNVRTEVKPGALGFVKSPRGLVIHMPQSIAECRKIWMPNIVDSRLRYEIHFSIFSNQSGEHIGQLLGEYMSFDECSLEDNIIIS